MNRFALAARRNLALCLLPDPALLRCLVWLGLIQTPSGDLGCILMPLLFYRFLSRLHPDDIPLDIAPHDS